jgi:hypothetical protein
LRKVHNTVTGFHFLLEIRLFYIAVQYGEHADIKAIARLNAEEHDRINVLNNPINLIDPFGLEPPKNIPPGVNMEQNVREAQKMSPLDFYNAVKSGGKWDYKTQGKQYEDFGNYNFGMTGRATGFSEDTLKRGAGAYQIKSGTSNPQWGWPWGKSPYGDDPNDQRWIGEGVKDFENWRDSPCP